MTQLRAMPIWVDAYCLDTQHLTFLQHGVYFRLLILLWKSPCCRIPSADAWVMRHFGNDPVFYRETVKPLILEFCHEEDAFYIQKRLLKEWTYCMERSQKSRESANYRWGNGNDQSERTRLASSSHQGRTNDASTSHDNRIEDASNSHMPNDHSGNAPVPVPVPVKKKEPPKSPKGEMTPQFLQFWELMPRKIEQSQAWRNWKRVVKAGADPKKIIEAAIAYAKEKAGEEINFVRKPGNWLSAKSWEDVIETPQKNGNEISASDMEGLLQMKHTPAQIELFRTLETHNKKWFFGVGYFLRIGTWQPHLPGPEPGRPGCMAPLDILRAFGFAP